MNYYEHHIGDYAQATGHLSILEDGVYSRLLRKYYADESPLPSDLKKLERLIGIKSAPEKRALRVVLEEFFEATDEGWHNARCDEEIARYQEKQAKARGSANARWSKRQAQCDGTADAMRTHPKKDANALPSQSEGNALQSPVSSLQSPSSLPSVESKSARAHEHAVGLTLQQVQQIKAAYPRGRYKPARWGDGEHCLQEHAARGIPFGVLLAGAERYAACWKAEGADERSVYGPQEFFSLSAPMFERPWAPSTGGKARAPSPKFMTAEEIEAQEAARATR